MSSGSVSWCRSEIDPLYSWPDAFRSPAPLLDQPRQVLVVLARNSVAPAEFGKAPRKVLRPRDSLVADHALVAVVRYEDRERHRFRWSIELHRDNHERLQVARLRAISGDLRMDLTAIAFPSDDLAPMVSQPQRCSRLRAAAA
jgi:hypothetical protein